MKKEKITIAFASVIEALFLLLEIYFMIHAKGNFPVLLIVAICMVAVLFFLVLSIIELSQKNKEKERLDYEEIYKAQKASYLAQRKYFDELNERLNQLEENTNFPAEDIITAQKAVAKVTISRSKENADALMNANDELIQRVFGFEEKLADNNDALLRQQETLLQQTREELVANNQGMQDQFAALHQALEQMKQEISDLELRQAAQPAESPVAESPAAEAQAPIPEEPVEDDAFAAAEETLAQETVEEPVIEESVAEPIIEEAVEMPEEAEEVTAAPEAEPVDNGGEISQAEIDAMLASLASDTEEMRQDETVIEEDAPMVDEGPVAAEEAEAIEEEAGETEEVPVMEDMPSVDDLPSLDELDDLDLPDLEEYTESADDLPDLDAIAEPEPMPEPAAEEKPQCRICQIRIRSCHRMRSQPYLQICKKSGVVMRNYGSFLNGI